MKFFCSNGAVEVGYFIHDNSMKRESEVKMGVASSRGLPWPLKCNYLSRATNIKGITVIAY